MEFLDTNYFLRFFLNDIPLQNQIVHTLFNNAAKKKEVLITETIIFFEIEWILSSLYKKTKQERLDILNAIMLMEFIYVPMKKTLQKALDYFQQYSINLEDAYILASCKRDSVKKLHTFDKKLQKVFATQKSN